LEETLDQCIREALAAHDCVIVDDLNLISDVAVGGCGSYPRSGFLNAALASLVEYVVAAQKKLIVGTVGYAGSPIEQRSYDFRIEEFEPADYEFLCHVYLGPAQARRLDYHKVHRFAPKLNAHQLKAASIWLQGDEELNTERFIDYLRS